MLQKAKDCDKKRAMMFAKGMMHPSIVCSVEDATIKSRTTAVIRKEAMKICLPPLISTNQQSFRSAMPTSNMMSAQPPPLYYPPYNYGVTPPGLDFVPSSVSACQYSRAYPYDGFYHIHSNNNRGCNRISSTHLRHQHKTHHLTILPATAALLHQS
jgi:hypothetical protein